MAQTQQTPSETDRFGLGIPREQLAALMEKQAIISGAWREQEAMEDYRSEWLSELLVERVTWSQGAPAHFIGGKQVAGPGYIWFRFWLASEHQVVEKYFSDTGESVGIHIPVCTSLVRDQQGYSTFGLILGLFLWPQGRLDVLREGDFDQAAASGQLPRPLVDVAEHSFRKLTAAIARKRFPPALVRNFELNVRRRQP